MVKWFLNFIGYDNKPRIIYDEYGRVTLTSEGKKHVISTIKKEQIKFIMDKSKNE